MNSIKTKPQYSPELVRNILLHGQQIEGTAITDKVLIPYHLIPGRVRLFLGKVLFWRMLNQIRKRSVCQGEAKHYLDNTVESLFTPDHTIKQGDGDWAWPKEKRSALVLSHDVDTAGQEKGIGLMREVASEFGISHTFSFVGRFLNTYQETLDRFRTEGIDIALHDVIHDNKIAFLKKQEIVTRLGEVENLRKRWDIKGFRSPSWYLSPNLWEVLNEMGFLYDMSALDTWSFFSTEKTHGIRTFLPFMYDNLVVLPNTIPFELPWLCGYRVEESLEFWKPKIDKIAKAGGLIMINAHPDSWYCGNKKAARELSRLLEYIIDRHDPVAMNGAELAVHMGLMREKRCVMTLPGSPELHLPQQKSLPMEQAIESNPILVKKTDFLAHVN
jgi:peptidoglycan/xylan/chitin deacetylase (PgdA/CDA1 family)